MATENRILQLLRSNRVYAPDAQTNKTAKEVAKAAVQALTGKKDGEILLARYQETGKAIKSLICVYHAHPSLPEGITAGWTFIEDASSSDAVLGGLQNEVDRIEASVGLGTDGTYTSPSDGTYVGQETTNTVKSDIAALDEAVDGIQDAINAMDLTQVGGTNGDVITAVSQADGQVSASASALTDVLMTGYSKTSDSGAIAATDTVEQAFNKLENTIAANDTARTVVSSDQSITVSTVASGADAGKTDVIVNVDKATIVKDSSSHAIKTTLKIAEVVTGTAGTDEIAGNLGTNVEKAYVLVDGSGNTYGKQIDIYKDSAVKAVKLSTVDATWDSTNNVIADGSGADALALAYTLSDGSVQVVTINVADFLRESEFSDGLTVANGVVKVKAGNGLEFGSADASDSNRKPLQIKIDNTNDPNGYLSVGANGLALNAASLTDAIENAATTLTTVAAVSETAADGTDFIKVTSSTESDGHTNYAVSTQGIKDYVAGQIAGLDGTADANGASTTATTPSADFKVLTKVVETDGAIVPASTEAVNLKKVAATGAAADVSYTNTTSSLTATNVQAAIDEVEGRVDALESSALTGVTAGNDGIAVGTAASNSQSVSLNLSSASDNVLAINATSGEEGLYLSNVWDCGTY